jgi:replicative DNA helicase
MSRESEEALLGCVMVSNQALDLIDLTPDHFTSLSHKLIYKAILDLRANDLAFDAITIAESLAASNDLEAAGGAPYLIQLSNAAPSARNILSYERIIKRDFKNSELEGIGLNIQMLGREGGDCEKNIEAALTLFDNLNLEGEKPIPELNDSLAEYIDILEKRAEGEAFQGLESGFEKIDERLNGLKPGELYIIAGRPAMGKSTYALNIASHNALKGERVLFFSLEMPREQLIEKMIAGKAGVELDSFKAARFNKDEWALVGSATGLFHDKNLFIDDNGLQTVKSLRVKCKKVRPSLVVVDYLQLMSGDSINRVEEISQISRGLKLLAKDMSCPVIALSQLNRGVESRKDKRPMLSDLRDSGAIEQDADVIQFVYRDEYYYPNEQGNKGFAEIITSKFRHGQTGTDYLETELSKSRFKDVISFTYQPYEEKGNSGGGFNG